MLYAEPFTRRFSTFAAHFIPSEKADRLANPVGEYFLLTLAAQLTTLPLMVYYFKRISLTALISNPLILPAKPALMIVVFLSNLTGMLFHPLGQMFAWAVEDISNHCVLFLRTHCYFCQ
jgi:competence protein ComEC